MTDDVEFVGSFDDLDSFADISGTDKITISQKVQDWTGHSHELVCWLPEWLAEEKDLKTVSGSEQVVTAICDRETDRAWLLKQKPRKVWVPKSVCIAFRRSKRFSIPQASIGDFGGGDE